MSGPSDRADRALAYLREASQLRLSGSGERAIEALRAAAELAVEEWAERDGIVADADAPEPHETRALLAAALRSTGRVPAGFDGLLRRFGHDQRRTSREGEACGFDEITLAQAEASVRLVVESLIGEPRPDDREGRFVPSPIPVGTPVPTSRPLAPLPDPDAPPLSRRPVLIAIALVGVAVLALLALVLLGGV